MRNLGYKKRKDSPFENFFKDLFIGLLVVGILSLIILTGINSITGNLIINKEKFQTCGDGTFYGTCSLEKPYYCSNGILMEK